MSYSEAEFCQGAVVAIVVSLLMLSAVMRRRNQHKSTAKTRKISQEHDERFFPERL